MSEKAFDFDSIVSVERRITRTTDSAPLSRKKDAKSGDVTFRMSQAAFDALGLELNSLKTVTSKDGANVFLGVCPGNEGDFYNSRGGKKKGNSVKHNELSAALDKAGMTGNQFSLTEAGTDKAGRKYFQVGSFLPAPKTPKAAPAKKAAVVA